MSKPIQPDLVKNIPDLVALLVMTGWVRMVCDSLLKAGLRQLDFLPFDKTDFLLLDIIDKFVATC